jgi:hypothetical protein
MEPVFTQECVNVPELLWSVSDVMEQAVLKFLILHLHNVKAEEVLLKLVGVVDVSSEPE